MKKILALAALVSTFGLMSFAATTTVKGFIMDSKCASMPGMMGNKACAVSCVKKGSPAVLVTKDAKVYQISNQDAVAKVIGDNVTVTGDVTGDSITVATVHAAHARHHAKK